MSSLKTPRRPFRRVVMCIVCSAFAAELMAVLLRYLSCLLHMGCEWDSSMVCYCARLDDLLRGEQDADFPCLYICRIQKVRFQARYMGDYHID